MPNPPNPQLKAVLAADTAALPRQAGLVQPAGEVRRPGAGPGQPGPLFPLPLENCLNVDLDALTSRPDLLS